MSGHHLVLGSLKDIVSGEILEDTHDERYRQKVARLLLEQKGFLATDIEPRRAFVVTAGEQKARVKVDFLALQFLSLVVLRKFHFEGFLVASFDSEQGLFKIRKHLPLTQHNRHFGAFSASDWFPFH